MIDSPTIVETSAQQAAMIRLTIPKADIRIVMGPAIQEVSAAATAQGIGPTGPWFSHHLRIVPDVWDFEVCVPVSAPVKSVGRVEPCLVPVFTAARTVYHGGYEGLGAAWGEFDAWIKDNGHTPAIDLWERYLKGPESGANAAEFRTELTRPLASR
jgi:effector-binding domain-containing protein